MHRFPFENIAKLDSDERRQILPPEKVLSLLNLQPNDVLLDIGAGIGYFTFPAADILSEEGKVLAVDVSEQMIAELKRRAEGRANITFICADAEQIPLPDEIADKVLMAFVLHEVSNRNRALQEIARLLKIDGIALIAEWEKTDSPGGPPLEHRISSSEMRELIASSPLEIIHSADLNPYQYAFVIKKQLLPEDEH